MKRVEKWFQKLDIFVILYIICVPIALIIGMSQSIILAGLCSVFVLPFLMYLLQNVMEKKQMNRGADIDTYFIVDSK